MNPPQSFHPWVAPLGWLALETSLVVLAALALQPLLRTAAARRSLWRAALLALLAVLAAELTGTGSQLPAQLRTAWQTTFPAPAPPIPPPIAIPVTEPPDSIPITYHPFPIPSAEAPVPLSFTPEPLAPPPPLPLSHPPTISPAPLFLWLAGLAALLARSACTHAGFAWLRLRHFLPAAEALRDRVQALAARLGLRRRVRVLASERLRAPAAFGWVRPGVGVPGDFTARFAPAQQDVMLAHELAHLAARDPLWQLLADFTAAALWWHPLVWVARRQHRLAGELAADDASQALPDGPVVLAECLLALGHEAADAPRAALGMAGFRSQLGRRVERLVTLPRADWQTPSRLRLALQTTTALAALAALALLPGCAANRATNEAPTSLLAQWWQAKSKSASSEQQTAVSPRPATPAPANTEPVTIQGRVSFHGTPPPEFDIPLPPPVLAKLLKPVITMNLGSLTTVTNGQTNTLHFETAVSFSVAADRLLAGLSRELGRDLTHLRLETETVSPPLQEFCGRHGIRHHETTGPLIRFHAGLVTFMGSKADSALVAKLLTTLAQPRLKTRLHRVSPDGGLADVLVYVKEGLAGQTFAAPTNTFFVRADRYEFEPYIGAIQAGQTVRWESHLATGLSIHPTPTNHENREFNFTLMAHKSLDARFTGPELFLRVKTDVFPWMYHYVNVLPHPYFAVTDAEGRFRFPRPLPPGKYTLAAVHRRAGESTQEINLRQPLPAGQPLDVQFQLGAKEVSAAAPTLPGPFTNGPVKSLTLRSYTPSAPLPRAELLEHKARVEAEIKEAEKVYRPTHPKMVGLRKQLETVEEALKQTPPVGDAVRSLTPPQAPAARPQASPSSQRLVTSSPTNVLDISVGRQLFVDDFLIESNTLQRTWHQPSVGGAPQLTVKSSGLLRGEFPFPESTWYDSVNQEFRLRFAFRTNSALFRSPTGTNWPSTNSGSFRSYSITDAAASTERPKWASTDYESHRVTLHRIYPRADEPSSSGLYLSVGWRGVPTTSVSPERTFIPAPRPADGVQWSDLHPLTNGFLVVGRNLHFYFGGRAQRPGEAYASAAVGLATLRRDGFASLDAGPEGGVMTTKPVTFTGRYLFVNLKTNAPNGELRVEILHPDGRPITVTKNDTKQESQPFALASANPLAADQTLMTVMWAGGISDLAMLVGRTVRFRFHLKNASLYSFWTSDSRFGRSRGPVAGGGPHFTEAVDTIGNRSYRPFPVVSTNTPPPKPSASAPVGDDVRSPTPPQTPDAKPQTPPSSQRLVTSSPTAEEAVQAEAVRRQERKAALDKLLAEAGQFLKVQSWTNAVGRFEEAAGHAKELGGEAVEKQYRDALAGLTHCRIQLAFALLEQHEFKAAAAEVDKIRPFDPLGPEVEQFKRFNERVEGANKATRDKPDGNSSQRTKAAGLVRDAKLYYEVHEYQEASQRLEEAITLDPMNDSAFFYLRLCMAAQFEREDATLREKGSGVGAGTSTRHWYGKNTPRNVSAATQKFFRGGLPPVYKLSGAQLINRKLDGIVIPEVHFDGVPLAEVVRRLSDDIRKFDAEPDVSRRGLNFFINDVSPQLPLLDANGNAVTGVRPVPLSEGLIRVSQPLKNLTLRHALDVICKNADQPTQFTVKEYAIAFIPRGPVAYYSRMFRVNPDAFIQGLQGVVGNPVVGQSVPAAGPAGQASSTAPAAPVRATVPATVPAAQRTAAEANALVRQFFQSAGVTALGATNGSTRVFFNPANGLLTARGTTNDLRVIEQAIEKLQPTAPLPANAAERDRPGRSGPASTNAAPRSALPNPIYKADNEVPFITNGRGAIYTNRKLDEIILPEVRFDGVPLPHVVVWLDEHSKKHDPEKKGLNFLINNVATDYITAGPVTPTSGKNGNQAVNPPRPAKVATPDLDTALVKVTATLTNLTLRQTLDVICKTAWVKPVEGRGQGLTYSVEDYAIVFSLKGPERAAQFSRMFKVAPATFIEGLRTVVDERELRPDTRAALEQALREKAWTNAPAGTSNRVTVAGVRGSAPSVGVVNTNGTDALNYLVRRYFTAAGVSNLGVTNGPDATQVFFNDRNGLLLVRASLQDLEIIQMAIELLNLKPPQIMIEAKFVEVNQNDSKALGFEWFTGQSVIGNPPAANNPARTNVAPGAASITGILTAPQFLS